MLPPPYYLLERASSNIKSSKEKSSSWSANKKMQRDTSLVLARALIISSANLIPGHKASLRLNKDGSRRSNPPQAALKFLNNNISQPARRRITSNLLATQAPNNHHHHPEHTNTAQRSKEAAHARHNKGAHGQPAASCPFSITLIRQVGGWTGGV
jgi:hypothetical protein